MKLVLNCGLPRRIQGVVTQRVVVPVVKHRATGEANGVAAAEGVVLREV